jgi:hypothetical protein
VISESNENDNEYTKTITVGGGAAPNLFPYNPVGWSDRIVVARAPGTKTDAASLATSDNLYVSWAVGNGGGGDGLLLHGPLRGRR